MKKFKHKQTKNTADELGDTFYAVKKDKAIICFLPNNMVENTLDWTEIKESVFTTADGVKMYEGDMYFAVIDNIFVKKFDVALNRDCRLNNNKRFSTQKLAQEDLDFNTPKYSLSDIKSVCYSSTGCGDLLQKLKNLK